MTSSSRYRRADAALEEACRDLLAQVMTRPFSNLLCLEAGFDFTRVVTPVLAELHEDLEKKVGDHVAGYIRRFTLHVDPSDKAEDKVPGGRGGDDGASSS